MAFSLRRGMVMLLVATFALGQVPARQADAQVAVTVPQDALADTIALCTDADACVLALEALIARLAAANPEAPLSIVLGSIVASVAAQYNAGALPATVASVAFDAASRVAAANYEAEIVAALDVAIAAVAAGDPIDVVAVAEASASPT